MEGHLYVTFLLHASCFFALRSSLSRAQQLAINASIKGSLRVGWITPESSASLPEAARHVSVPSHLLVRFWQPVHGEWWAPLSWLQSQDPMVKGITAARPSRLLQTACSHMPTTSQSTGVSAVHTRGQGAAKGAPACPGLRGVVSGSGRQCRDNSGIN